MIEIQEIYEAYRKLKSYFYYDNTSHFARKRIAEFESNLQFEDDSKESFKKGFSLAMSEILTVVNKNKGWEKVWKKWLKEDVDCVILPKSFSDQNSEESSIMYVNNMANVKKTGVESVNAVIDASVNIHLVCVLWLMRVGLGLSSLVDANNYAYRLATHEDDEEEKEMDNGLSIYKPYFLGYQSWRDNTLRKAKSLLNEKKDVAIVSLDIKRYF